MDGDTQMLDYEREYDERFSWRRSRQIANLQEMLTATQLGVISPLEVFPKLRCQLVTDDPKDALAWSIVMLWMEATECYILGEFQSCILVCGAVVERCLNLQYQLARGFTLLGDKWTLGNWIKRCGGIVSPQVLEWAGEILRLRNSQAHAKLELAEPQSAIMGSRERGIDVRSPHHYLIEPYRGDAKKSIVDAYKILAELFGKASCS
jgi:hypothetical protein